MSDTRRTGRCLARWLTAAVSAGVVIAMSVPSFTTSVAMATTTPAPSTSASASASPARPILDSVWCAGADRCLAVGYRDGDAISEAWNGSSWRSVKIHSLNDLFSLACTSWTSCMAVGQNADIDHWNGTSWKALAAPPHDALVSVACPASRFCVAVGAAIAGTVASPALVWRGTSWKAVHLPLPAHADSVVLSHVACTSAKNCLVVGAATIDGKVRRLALAWNGTSWRTVAAPHLNIRALACPRPGLCVGIAAGWSLTWNGRSWQHARLAGITAPAGLSCPGTSFCMANTGTKTVTWNGSTWSPIAPAGIFTSALWCHSRTSCMTVGGGSFAGNTSQWNGKTWRPLRVIKVDSLLTVSCATATHCLARLSANDPDLVQPAEQWNGSTWAIASGPSGGGDPTLSCPTVKFCLAVGDSTAQRWNGHSWEPVPVPALHGGFLTALSCASPDSCVAVGTNATAVWNGTGWKTADAGISGQSVVLTSVSCAGTGCMAVGYDRPAGCVDDNCDFFQLAEHSGMAPPGRSPTTPTSASATARRPAAWSPARPPGSAWRWSVPRPSSGPPPVRPGSR